MKKKILFISNHASFFFSHRYNIYLESLNYNSNFKLVFGNAASKTMEKIALKKFKADKLNYKKLNFSHDKISLNNDFKSLKSIKKIILDFQPNVIHSASPKANLYALIMANIFRNIKFVISFSGLGYIFTNSENNVLVSFKKLIFITVVKFLINNTKNIHLIIQNSDDFNYFKKNFKINRKNIHLVFGGSGVNFSKFNRKNKFKSKNILMVSRITKNKGAMEYFKSAEFLKKKYKDWNFFIAGAIDYKTPDKISEKYLDKLKKKKIINFLGYSENVSKILKSSEIFCLPSYREGMPKVVLEALSCGVPVVTTKVPGCRESIINKFNGLLCNPCDYIDLSNKIEKLILNKNLRRKLSLNASKYARKNFSVKTITKKIYRIYDL